MLKVRQADIADAEGIDAFLRMRGLPPSTLWAWRDILSESYDAPCQFLVARRGDIVGILGYYLVKTATGKTRLYSLRHGFAAMDPEAARALAKACRSIALEAGAIAATVTSGAIYIDLPYLHWTKTSLVMALQDNAETMWKSLRDKVRNMVRRAERADITVDESTAFMDAFYAGYCQRLGPKFVPLHSRQFFDSMLRKSECALYTARIGKRILGGILVQYGAGGASYFQSGFLPEAVPTGTGQLLLWHAVKACIARGIPVLDLGESEPQSGAYNFKAFFGAHAHDVHYYDLMAEPRTATSSNTPSSTRRAMVDRVIAYLPAGPRNSALRWRRRTGRLV